VLVLVGAFLIYDAVSLAAGFAKVDPVGPKFFPLVVGFGLLLTALILAIAIARGSQGEADAGEDIDPDAPSDWRTVGLLMAMFVATIALVEPLGRPVAQQVAEPLLKLAAHHGPSWTRG